MCKIIIRLNLSQHIMYLQSILEAWKIEYTPITPLAIGPKAANHQRHSWDYLCGNILFSKNIDIFKW